MLQRLRPSIGSAHVIALLALFAALGGGYAMAFAGSGTLQKAVTTPGMNFADARSLNGFGTLQLRCAGSSVDIRLHNTTSSDEFVRSFSEKEADYSSDVVAAGAFQPAINVPTSDTTRLHIFKASGSKQSVDVVVSTASQLVCGETHILALNSVE